MERNDSVSCRKKRRENVAKAEIVKLSWLREASMKWREIVMWHRNSEASKTQEIIIENIA
jgi:hypothetical protein